jgi:hypothetical protein
VPREAIANDVRRSAAVGRDAKAATAAGTHADASHESCDPALANVEISARE